MSLAATVIALLMSFAATADQVADPRVLRISTPGVPEEVQSKSLAVFKTELEKLAPRQFDVQIHLNGTLFVQGTEIYALQRNNLEMALISAQDISKQIPEYGVFTAGYLARDAAHQQAVFGGEIGREFYDRVARDMNIRILGIQYLGTRQLSLRSVRDIDDPSDLTGVKLRMPGSEAWQFLGRALGASPTPMDFNEVYLGLQTGTIDAQDNPLPVMIEAKFYEVTEQIVLTSHLVDGVFVAIGKHYWDDLSPGQQEAVKTAVNAAIAFNNSANLEAEQDAQAFLTSKGLTVTTPDRDAFRAAVQRAYRESEYSKVWQPGLLERINAVR
jgi:tripartite ATP-independent transporter DctP family solute receptor